MTRINVAIGSVFGDWTVIGAETRHKRLMLPCRCKCGKNAFITKDALIHYKSKSCLSCARKRQPIRELSPCWRGGRREEGGYILVYKPEHPRAKKNGYIREHTIIMEDFLGRYITKGESVHHKNGDRKDNRLENLELWSHYQPYGQRVEDKVAWAIEILREYKSECLNLC